jgi:hypothetical protein
MTLSADAAGLRARSSPATSATSPKSTGRFLIAPSQGKLCPRKPFRSSGGGWLKIFTFRRQIHRPERCYSATARPPSGDRTEVAPYASSPSSFPTSRRPSRRRVRSSSSDLSQPAVKLVGGAATAQSQGYARPDEESRLGDARLMTRSRPTL